MEQEQEDHLKLLLPLFREHLPAKLAELAFDRVPMTLPPQYLRNAMASCLACRVVYTEGAACLSCCEPSKSLSATITDDWQICKN